MEVNFAKTGRSWGSVISACFLASILCAAVATLDRLHLLPFALVGVLIPLLYPLVTQKYKKYALGILLALAVLFLFVRFTSVLDGLKLLANRLFSQSELTQSYEYDYFATISENAAEAVLLLSILAGVGAALWKQWFNGVLAAVTVIAMAYFGVTPELPWLAALVLTAAWSMLPGKHRMIYALAVCLLVGGFAMASQQIAPEPNKTISVWDEQLRDVLAGSPITYEQIPIPTEVPEPEIIPNPDTEKEQPDHGVQNLAINILFLILATVTALLLFVPAIIKDLAEKRRKKNREGLDAQDHAAAIRAMYLYAKRWEKLSAAHIDPTAEVYEIWQEAAYSDHTLTEEKREIMHRYVVDTATAVWQAAPRKKKLMIQYKLAL